MNTLITAKRKTKAHGVDTKMWFKERRALIEKVKHPWCLRVDLTMWGLCIFIGITLGPPILKRIRLPHSLYFMTLWNHLLYQTDKTACTTPSFLPNIVRAVCVASIITGSSDTVRTRMGKILAVWKLMKVNIKCQLKDKQVMHVWDSVGLIHSLCI